MGHSKVPAVAACVGAAGDGSALPKSWCPPVWVLRRRSSLASRAVWMPDVLQDICWWAVACAVQTSPASTTGKWFLGVVALYWGEK